MKPGPSQTSFGEFTGHSLPEKITSTRNQLFVKFTSDTNNDSSYGSFYGFEAIFNAVKTDLWNKMVKYTDLEAGLICWYGKKMLN